MPTSENTPDVPAITVRDVSKIYRMYPDNLARLKEALSFGSGCYHTDFYALHHLSLEVRPGERVGIIGRNGSGKTTLMKIIAGVISPSSGTVTVKGRISAMLALGTGFNPIMTGMENIFFAGAIMGYSREEMRERIEAIVKFADIGEFVNQPVRSYSSGMTARLGFAVAAHVEPDILLVDEALSVGDLLFQKRCFDRINRIAESGATILFVSHDLESVRQLTTRTIFLREGRMIADGAPGDIILAYRKFLHEVEFGAGSVFVPPQLPTATATIEPTALTAAEGVANVPLPASRPALSAPPDTAVRANKAYGDFDAVVNGVEVLGADRQPCPVFYPGERQIIRVSVRFKKRCNHINVNLRLRNREGVKIYSWGTLNADIELQASGEQQNLTWNRFFEADTTYVWEFSSIMRLGQNFYEVQVAVNEQEKSHYNSSQRMMCWLDEAAFFEARQNTSEYFFGGAFDLQMTATLMQ